MVKSLKSKIAGKERVYVQFGFWLVLLRQESKWLVKKFRHNFLYITGTYIMYAMQCIPSSTPQEPLSRHKTLNFILQKPQTVRHNHTTSEILYT